LKFNLLVLTLTLIHLSICYFIIVSQKSAFNLNCLSFLSDIIPAFWYSPTLFSKKFVFPYNDIISIQSKGFLALNIFWYPRAKINLSATNSIYCFINFELIPISSTGNASEMNSFSISTASAIIEWIFSYVSFPFNNEYIKHAKSQCNPSSLEISSFENVNPGINDLFFNQNIAQKLPEKNIPSTAAKATILSANLFFLLIHFNAQLAFLLITGTFYIALNKNVFSF